MRVYTSGSSGTPYGTSSYPDFVDFGDRITSFDNLAAYTAFAPMNLGRGGDTERVQGAVVTSNFFELLKLRPAQGRFFIPGDDTALGNSPVAVLSHDLWERDFGGSPDAVGGPITINGSAFTVIGVAPRRFRGLDLTDAPALWR
jgi:putative ABC transport system permease protein